MRGAMWLRWSGHDGIRTLHHSAGLARGRTERDVDGLDGWVALAERPIVYSVRPGGPPEPVVHAEAWEAGATLHAALAQHPAPTHLTQEEDESDGQEHALLGDLLSRIRRRAAGMTLENIQQALEQAQFEERCADRHADAGHESAYATAADTLAEWQRIHDHTAATRAEPPALRPRPRHRPPAHAERYDPDHDTALQHAPSATTPTTTPPSSTRCAVSTTGRTSPTVPARPPTRPDRPPTSPTAASPAPQPSPSTPPSTAPASTPSPTTTTKPSATSPAPSTPPRCARS
ncbi:hypothetical protein ACIG0C_36095 [Kitasatospora aureofaciens]|uniref:hypothetical protein n=1 Tax=Kitasatospora aureofaciens TaxID=1894 RepID=UPI001785B55C|nr:hypothetical protein [Kitasatospora aureofaciens]